MSARDGQVSKYSSYPKCSTHSLGIIQLTCGIISVVCGAVGLFIHVNHLSGGIGYGVVFVVTGGIAVGAFRSKGTKCLVIAVLVLSIISAVCAGAQLIQFIMFSVIQDYSYVTYCINNPDCHRTNYLYSPRYYCTYNSTEGACQVVWNQRYNTSTTTKTYRTFRPGCQLDVCDVPPSYEYRHIELGLNITLAVLGLLELVVAIVHSGYSCAAVCGRSTNRPAVVYYQVGGSGIQPSQIVLQIPPGQTTGQPPVYELATHPLILGPAQPTPSQLPPAVPLQAVGESAAPPSYREDV